MDNQDNQDSKFDVIGFGALNVDKMFHVDSIAGIDGESFIKDSVIECGGSAANTIIGLSRLGLKTSYIGKVAEDDDGELLEFNLVSEGVFLEHLIYDDSGKTGNVLGFIDDTGNRELYVNPGVNDEIVIGEINTSALNTNIIHYSGFVANSFNTQIELLNHLDNNIVLSFDPGALYAKKGFDAIKPILIRTNILLINEIELDTLFNSLNNANGIKVSSFRDKAIYLLNLGIDTVIIKRGEKGVYGINSKEEVKIPAFKADLVDTTCAGDSFNAGFLYSY
ncbi:MAG: carbohydrate kinase family protein, partial [Methanobacteriaceae archaeon]